MNVMSQMSSRAAQSVNSSSIRSNTSSSQPTRSILLTQTTRCGIRSSDAIYACRRVCSETPLRASTRITDRSAVEAPVTMLRVYCSCPGVSAMMNFRRLVWK